MKKTWTTEQIVLLLREAESGTTSISELCRQKGISQNSFYKWRQQYGGVGIPEAPPKDSMVVVKGKHR